MLTIQAAKMMRLISNSALQVWLYFNRILC
jgi:hypothetical protein